MVVHKRQPTDQEPVFYHSPEPKLFDELIHNFDMVGALDWTPGEGFAAINFIRRRKPYLGICFKQSHVEGLYTRIEQLVVKCMLTVDDDLYDPKFAALVKNTDAEDAKNGKKKCKDNEKKPTGKDPEKPKDPEKKPAAKGPEKKGGTPTGKDSEKKGKETDPETEEPQLFQPIRNHNPNGFVSPSMHV